MKRKLVSIQKIEELNPIEGMDRIELATVEGWQVIVQKRYKVGDLVIFCEIDTVLPKHPEFDFLKSKGYRVKTMKMHGVLSQGIVFPIEILEKVVPAVSKIEGNKVYFKNSVLELEEGKDITGLIGAKKYEIPPAGNVKKEGSLPEWIPITDEPHIQSNKKFLSLFDGEHWVSTVKIDGTSATYAIRNGQIIVGSHHMQLEKADNYYWLVYDKYRIENILNVFKTDDDDYLIIQGEIAGPRIQKNPLGLEEYKFFVFSIIINGRFMGYDEMINFCKLYNLETVPFDMEATGFSFTIPQLLELAKGVYDNGHTREGIVIRAKDKMYKNGYRMSFKVINNDYLL